MSDRRHAQDAHDEDHGVPALPDFAGTGSAARADGSRGTHDGLGTPSGGGADGPDGPSPAHGAPGDGPGGRGPLLALLLGGGGCLVVVLAVAALVLSQTVLRSDPESPGEGAPTGATAPPASEGGPSDGGSSDGGPSDDDPSGDTAPADQDPAIEAEPSGTACTVPPESSATEQVTGAVRGGGLEIPQPEGWETGTDWGSQTPYLTDAHYADQPVESGWYAVAGVGAVEFPDEEGGYPGAEEAARTIFRCALEPAQGEEIYGDPAMLRNLRDEATTIDGHDAWIISADVEISDLALLHSTDAWRRVVIVVDTPDGPAAFDGGAALGHEQQVADLEAMLEGLTVL